MKINDTWRRAELAAKYRLASGASKEAAWLAELNADGYDWRRPQWDAADIFQICKKFTPEPFDCSNGEYLGVIYNAIKNAVQESFDIGNGGKHSKFGCFIAHAWAAHVVNGKLLPQLNCIEEEND